jgi:hypothetical protein
MNELQEFFKKATEEKRLAVEKKKIQEEWNRKLNPPIDFSSSKLGNFFGAVNTFKKEHVLVAREIKKEETKQESKVNALQVFFDKLNGFEKSLSEQIEQQEKDVETPKQEKTESETKQEELEPIVETLHKVKEDTVANVVNVMSGLGFKKEEVVPLSDLQKLQLEFRHFKDIVSRQMASIGGGGEVRLLNLDDVDTSSLGNGKFLAYNSTTRKLEFTDQVDGN